MRVTFVLTSELNLHPVIHMKDLVQYLAQGSSIKGNDIEVIITINEKHTVLLQQKTEIANIFFKPKLE